MLKNSSFLDMLMWNIILAGVWHVVTFLSCQKLPDSIFDASKNRYMAKQWEHGGRWYRDNLKIQCWKDRVPQYIGKGGFSKKHFTNDTIEYLDQFIMETCRGEWMHLKNCLCVVVTIIIDPLLVGMLFSLFILIGNLPFAIIQRYNRFRLQMLRKRRIHELSGANDLGRNTVTA